MNQEKDFLGTMPVGRLLWKLAIPTVTAQVINMLYNIVDRIYIGHIPEVGAAALTGVGVCMPLIMIVTAFAAFAGFGGAPRASIYMGKGDHASAEKTLGNCFVIQCIISVLLTAALLLWNRDFLMAFGASENTIEYGVNYMNIYAIGTIFVQMTLGMNAFITAQGFAKTGMLSVLIGAVANIILDPIFIFAFQMGVEGAALATIISQAMSCAWVLLFLCGKKTRLKLHWKNMALKAGIVLPCMALGLSTFIMQGSESVISICFNSSLLRYGGDIAVGAMTILTSVMQFAMLPLQGLGQGAQPIISYNYGARNPDRVKAAYKLLLKASLVYSTLLWGFVMLFPQAFAAMFTDSAPLLAFTGNALRIYMACLLLFGIQIACQMTFTSLGNAKASILVAVMRKFILLIPLIYVMPLIFPADKTTAVYMAEPVADFIAVSFTVILFTFQFRKSLKQISEMPAKAEDTK
ncbi:MATE family efflux transporter [Christensenellaceae bacterium NSJ-63]|uniref:Multidrug export protein MepA n=1 Tax=Guopingia tenuis TaxID=2763656 RepID=A0A926HTB7_9FIRM|nr:MATE family efflux transporter [Guopingia tenuis]MBC8539342.1 MATE family efflux transporter [Guopingia tenuis]